MYFLSKHNASSTTNPSTLRRLWMRTRSFTFLCGVVGITALASLQPMGCITGKQPQLTNYCSAYKSCKCRDLFGEDLNRCSQAVDNQTNNSPNDRDKDQWCQDLYEKSSCFAPLPSNKRKSAVFQGGAKINFPQQGSGWVRGKCARAIMCCLQIRASTDREKCLEKLNGITDENECAKKAGELGLRLGSCNPTTPATGGAPPPRRPGPEPAREPSPKPSTETVTDGGTNEK